MRVLLDYRAALRERSGVGEYTHQLTRALIRAGGQGRGVDLTVFSSSRKDRLPVDADLDGARRVDRQIPVRLLNFAWHRLGWPPAEALAGNRFDVVHSMHPLLMPARHAAQVVTIHDLNFLLHPERARAEIRRDYPALVRDHAFRADRVIVVSQFTADDVTARLGLPPERMSICSPGGPGWAPRAQAPENGYLLFFGTLEPRKNVGGLLDAYEILADRRKDLPILVLAGKATEQSTPWLERIQKAPLAGRVRHLGYIDPDKRRDLYAGARLLIQPSFEEGFGLPVLEAMTVGVPVVAARVGALPEVGGDAVRLVDPMDPESIATEIERLLDDAAVAASCVTRGFVRAARYTWDRTAADTLDAYASALSRREQRGAA